MSINNYRVKIDTASQETVTFDSGVTLYKDTRMNFSEHVTLIGKCTHVAINDPWNIQKGDNLYFRYDVVGDGDFNEMGQRIYKNLLIMPDGSWEWFVPHWSLVGYERDGKLVLVNDLVIAKPTKKHAWTSSFLVQAEQFADITTEDVVEIVQNDTALPLEVGDRVLSQRQYHQHYNFTSHYGKDVLVIPSKYLLAKL